MKTVWEAQFGKPAPFGKLRQLWKTEHCTKVNVYGTHCPYSETDCAIAFLTAVERTAHANPARPTGYFRSVAITMGLDRADNKPLARAIVERTDVRKEGNPSGLRRGDTPGHDRDGDGLEGAVVRQGDQDAEPDDLHRPGRRPVSVGDVLGSLHLGARQTPAKDGEESK